tara:strand:- start:25 stop:456 length:432 start_codon:yes stop_codon:yes gene_type:complete
MKNLILLASILFLSSCVKEEYFEYPNRYFKTAEVLALPALNYDADNSAPDIRIDLKRRSANNWEFSTFTEDNSNFLPTTTVFPAEILATDEVWEIRIVDEDLNEFQDDEIFFWEFHAYEEGANGDFEFYADGNLIMILNFNER